jgi:hypothetical protein
MEVIFFVLPKGNRNWLFIEAIMKEEMTNFEVPLFNLKKTYFEKTEIGRLEIPDHLSDLQAEFEEAIKAIGKGLLSVRIIYAFDESLFVGQIRKKREWSDPAIDGTMLA